MYNIHVIGVSDPLLSRSTEALLSECNHIFATVRMHEMVAHCNATLHNISPLSEAIAAMGEQLKNAHVAVLASGDPLFYGIGKRLIKEFGHDKLRFHPALSSIQRASALFKTPWDDCNIISLHGRRCDHIPGLILQQEKSLLLTDSSNSPDMISNQLRSYLDLIDDGERAKSIRVHVAENIGLKEENVFTGTLEEACGHTFAPLNVVLITLEKPKQPATRLGLREDEICHSRGLITKSEVRSATLHQLCLPVNGVFWDVGAGSGSVSIEAARMNPGLTIYAIEHKEEEIQNIKANIRKFACYNIIPVHGRAPASLHDLPTPDRIFVGGSSGTLPAIVKLAGETLAPDGTIVINGVIEKTIAAAPVLLKDNDFIVETTRVHVSRRDREGEETVFNPITITTGRR